MTRKVRGFESLSLRLAVQPTIREWLRRSRVCPLEALCQPSVVWDEPGSAASVYDGMGDESTRVQRESAGSGGRLRGIRELGVRVCCPPRRPDGRRGYVPRSWGAQRMSLPPAPIGAGVPDLDGPPRRRESGWVESHVGPTAITPAAGPHVSDMAHGATPPPSSWPRRPSDRIDCTPRASARPAWPSR